jgi:hypothetical protein
MNPIVHDSAAAVITAVRTAEAYSPWWTNLTACRDATNPVPPQCYYERVRWPVLMTAGWCPLHIALRLISLIR